MDVLTLLFLKSLSRKVYFLQCTSLCMCGEYLCVRFYPGLTETQLDVAHALVPNLNAEMSNFCARVCIV